jgi:hypothetical protein
LAVASHCFTIARNSSTVMPLWVSATRCAKSWMVNLAIASRLPERIDLNGSWSFHSGCVAASAFTRSNANITWV